MRVAGLGFRGAATFESLNNALEKAGGHVEALATAEVKAGQPAIRVLAKALRLPLHGISRAALAMPVPSHTTPSGFHAKPVNIVERRYSVSAHAPAMTSVSASAPPRLFPLARTNRHASNVPMAGYTAR